MIKKCYGNDVAAYAMSYVRTATDGNTSVAPNLEKGFFAVATYWR